MGNAPKILAITRRPGELCASQALLGSTGAQLVAATSMAAARVILRSVKVQAVLLCHGSWPAAERDAMLAELRATCPELTILVRCPGCTECAKPGQLVDEAPIASLIAALGRFHSD